MSGSFGDLLKQAGLSASAPAAAPEPAAHASADPEVRYAAKVVVRTERAGRKGKEVTAIQGVVEGREQLARKLRKQLGTGAGVEGERIVLQGDQVDRLVRILEAEGVRKVVRG